MTNSTDKFSDEQQSWGLKMITAYFRCQEKNPGRSPGDRRDSRVWHDSGDRRREEIDFHLLRLEVIRE